MAHRVIYNAKVKPQIIHGTYQRQVVKHLNRESGCMHKIFLDKNIPVQLKSGSQNLLTPTECIVASYLMSGYQRDNIAIELHRSVNTIKHHTTNIKIKCDCETHIELGATLHSFLKNGP